MIVVQSLTSTDYDYVIVGGGTAGCMVASRLAEHLPAANNPEMIKSSLNLIGGDSDFDYPVVEQSNGNAVPHLRAKMPGGCSSHNGGISMVPSAYGMQRWEEAGCNGWTMVVDEVTVTNQSSNGIRKPASWIKSCSNAPGLPVIQDANAELGQGEAVSGGTGYLPISYDPESGRRHSASTDYIYPILKGEWNRPNLPRPRSRGRVSLTSRDPMAVVDASLRVRGLENVRVADAGVMPYVTSCNPMLTVFAIGERADELIVMGAGWQPDATVKALMFTLSGELVLERASRSTGETKWTTYPTISVYSVKVDWSLVKKDGWMVPP